eukprot:15130029-Alexandrium_andersonii.AAC.1
MDGLAMAKVAVHMTCSLWLRARRTGRGGCSACSASRSSKSAPSQGLGPGRLDGPSPFVLVATAPGGWGA